MDQEELNTTLANITKGLETSVTTGDLAAISNLVAELGRFRTALISGRELARQVLVSVATETLDVCDVKIDTIEAVEEAEDASAQAAITSANIEKLRTLVNAQKTDEAEPMIERRLYCLKCGEPIQQIETQIKEVTNRSDVLVTEADQLVYDFVDSDDDYLTGNWQGADDEDMSFECGCSEWQTEEAILELVKKGKAKMMTEEEADGDNINGPQGSV